MRKSLPLTSSLAGMESSLLFARLSFLAILELSCVGQMAAQVPSTWPTITPQELGLKDNVLSPGEAAVILDYEIETDNTKSTETSYKRIKVFREEGRKYANVEISYLEKQTQIEAIRARVTSPDGKSEEFNGSIFDKEIVRFKKFRVNAKTFSLPDVEPGSIIEYSFRLHWRSDIPDVIKNPGRYVISRAYAYPAAEWDVQQDLFVRRAHLVLHPIKGARTATFTHEMPKNALKEVRPDGTVEIDVENVPAFQKEEYAPPEENEKIRADVFYILGLVQDPKYYWLELAREESKSLEEFIGKPKTVQKELDRLLGPGDSDETKLRKIYTRSQQIRALSFEPERSKKEREHESLKENKNVEDVLKHGYAFNNEVNLVFIALARAAGFQAYPLRIAARNRAYFVPERLDPRQLNSLVVEVSAGPKTEFLDPATVYCPYGLLPWEETDAGGIRVDSVRESVEDTPMAKSQDAVTRRQAEFKLDAEGNLEGNVDISYEGQEALSRRIKAIDQDEAQRKKDLEESLQRSLPQAASVKLLSSDGWETSETPLKARFQIQVANYANRVGKRLVLPVGIFHATNQSAFASARRLHAVYLEYPYEGYDDVKVALPSNIQVESLPADLTVDRGLAIYESKAEKEANVLRLRRTFKLQVYYLPVERYAALREFYEKVRGADEQQAILKPLQASEKQ